MQRKILPDGIFVADDFCATICLRAFKEAGIKVPEQMAIVGFNNDPITRLVEPQLTTIHHPIREMGTLSARNLIEQLDYPGKTTSNEVVVLKSKLIIRGSTTKTRNRW